MAKIRNVAIFVLAVCMLLSICAMSAGCSDSDKIKELQQQITELENQISEQTEKNDELEKGIASQNGKIDELEKENKNFSDRIKDLESQIQKGYFCAFTEAYDLGLLSQSDLMSIAYYHNGGTRYNEEIMGEGYTPSPKNPEVLSEETELLIKQAYLYKYLKNHKNVTLEDISIGSSYYGTYNNCVVVKVWCVDLGYSLVVGQESISGVNIKYSNQNRILVWVKN